jgi:hypothetical protein
MYHVRTQVIELAAASVSPKNHRCTCVGQNKTKNPLAIGRAAGPGRRGWRRPCGPYRPGPEHASTGRESIAVMAPCRRPGTCCRRHARAAPHGTTTTAPGCVRACSAGRPRLRSAGWRPRPRVNDVVPGGLNRAARDSTQRAMGHGQRPQRARAAQPSVQRVGVSARRRGKRMTLCAAGLHARKKGRRSAGSRSPPDEICVHTSPRLLVTSQSDLREW